MRPYYEDETVTLYCGDAIEVMADLPDRSVDAVLTDPPFSSGGRLETTRAKQARMIRSVKDEDWIRGDGMSTQGFLWFMRLAAMQWHRILTSGGHALAFTDWRMAPNLAAALESADLRQHPTVVWNKTYFGMGHVFRNQYELVVDVTAGNPRPPQRRDVGNVIDCAPIRSKLHPTEKPQHLLRTLLSVVAAPGGVVLDPFAGSGATLLAARDLGAKAIGIEIDERYCEITATRLQQEASLTAVALAPEATELPGQTSLLDELEAAS